MGAPAVRLQTQAVKWDLPGRLWQDQASLEPDLKKVMVGGHWAGQHDPDPG